ncbi:MAG: atpH [Verrucomicrobiales bacterium]|nr:atpH [Verrucomicrobiales bacterium]
MKISKQASRDGKSLFQSCRVNGILDENKVRQAVKAVLDGKPRGYKAVLSQLVRLVKLDFARRDARVESAHILDSAMQGKIQQDLAKIYGPGLNIAYSQNPSLLGGVRIQVGSDVYDGSVKARLHLLEQSF